MLRLPITKKGREGKKQYIKISAAITVVGSLYISGVVHTALKTLDIAKTFNPIWHIRVSAKYGAPFLLFLILFAMFAYGFWFLYKNQVKMFEEEDELKNFVSPTVSETAGSAKWAKKADVQDVVAIQKPEEAYSDVLGMLTPDGDKWIMTKPVTENGRSNLDLPNSNIFILAPTGGQKTVSITMNQIMQAVKRRNSIIVTDPKGELYQKTAKYMRKNGFHVAKIDFRNFSKGVRLNLLSSIRKDKAEFDAEVFANAVVEMDETGRSTESIYKNGPRMLLKAIILRVLLDPTLPESEKNLITVYNHLNEAGLQGEEYLDNLFSESMPEAAKPSRAAYGSYKGTSPNLRGNIIVNLTAVLQVITSKEVSRAITTDELDFTLPAYEPCIYYLEFDVAGTFKFLTALFISMIFNCLCAIADERDEHCLPVDCLFLLDETYSLGKLLRWPQQVSTMRSRGIRTTMVFQNFTKCEEIYGVTGCNSLMSDCAIWIILGVNDNETAKYIADRLGKATVVREMERHGAVESPLKIHFARTRTEVERYLLNPDELQRLHSNEEIISIQGHKPIHAYKCRYFDFNPEAVNLEPTLNAEIPDIGDIAALVSERRAEEDMLDEYYKKFPEAKKPVDLSKHLKDSEYPEADMSIFKEIALDIAEDTKAGAEKFKKFVKTGRKGSPVYEFDEIDIKGQKPESQPAVRKKQAYITLDPNILINLEENETQSCFSSGEIGKTTIRQPKWLKAAKKGTSYPVDKNA